MPTIIVRTEANEKQSHLLGNFYKHQLSEKNCEKRLYFNRTIIQRLI